MVLTYFFEVKPTLEKLCTLVMTVFCERLYKQCFQLSISRKDTLVTQWQPYFNIGVRLERGERESCSSSSRQTEGSLNVFFRRLRDWLPLVLILVECVFYFDLQGKFSRS